MIQFLNKKYFKVFLIAVFLFLIFFSYEKVLAATVDCSGAGSHVQCPALYGDNVTMSVRPYNDQGDPIMGEVTYTWTLVTPNLGVLTVLTSSPLTLGNPSRANLLLGFSVPSGFINVEAAYGGISIIKGFNIVIDANASCQAAEPRLYYGIASVKDSNNAWQSSTAEVLETCKNEYKLYEGIGEGG